MDEKTSLLHSTPDDEDDASPKAATELPEPDFSPRMMLLAFCVVYFFVWFDRGVYSATLESLENRFGMSNFQAGFAGGVHLVGYLLASPVSAQLSHTVPPFKLCGFGMLVWATASAFAGLAYGFFALVVARAASGVGEASFLCLSYPLIDAFAPPSRRSFWLGLFMSMNPIGFAAGSILGGVVPNAQPVVNAFAWEYAPESNQTTVEIGRANSWRIMYLAEAVLVVPWIGLMLTLKGPASIDHVEAIKNAKDNHLAEIPQVHRESGWRGTKQDVICVLRSRIWLFVVAAYTLQTFSLGAIALFAIQFLTKEFTIDGSLASTIFGVSTLCSGTAGPLVGGLVLDARKPKNEPTNVQLMQVATEQLIWLSVLAAPLISMICVLRNLEVSVTIFVFAELVIFGCMVPFNCVLLWSLPVSEQALGMALATGCMHLLGDCISGPIVGALIDATGQRSGLAIGTLPPLYLLIFVLFKVSHDLKKMRSTETTAIREERASQVAS